MKLPKDSASPLPTEYGAEVLCAGWNPAAASLPEVTAASCARSGNVAAVDAESFLASFYRLQQT